MSASEGRIPAFLRNVSLFRELNPDEIEAIAAQTRTIALGRNDILFHQKDEPKGLYFVLYGQVKLCFTSPRGDEKVVEVFGAGQSFGEAVMFLSRPYPVTAQALGDAMVLFVSKEVIFENLQRDHRFAARMMAGLSRRIHGLMADLEANSMYSGVQRVIGFLLRDLGETEIRGAMETRLPTSKGVVASRLNITQEHFSRILHELSSKGLIEVDGRSIRVPDVERLRQYTP
jgi:CRP-like cAMP-binding protein